jgi:class 3 adenylate cyclase
MVGHISSNFWTILDILKTFLGNQHVDEIAQLALLMVRSTKTMKESSVKFPNINIMIGIHSGNTVAGVIGSKMPRYYLYGETVKVASRMETTGAPGQIQISAATKTLLDLTENGTYIIRPRAGTIPVKVTVS